MERPDNLVTILAATLPAGDPAEAERRLRPVLEALPEDQRRRVLANRRPVDRALRLMVRALLALGLRQATGLGARAALAGLRTDEVGRPICRGALFSFSHSAPHAVCAWAAPDLATGLGVDVEAVQKLAPDEFSQVFTAGELARIKAAADPDGELIRRWTVKEAVLKARGLGFSADPLAVATDPETEGAAAGGAVWRHLELAEGFKFTVAAAGERDFKIQSRRLEIFDCLEPFVLSQGHESSKHCRNVPGCGIIGGMLAATAVAPVFIPSFFAFFMKFTAQEKV